jgi:hypothetical protein
MALCRAASASACLNPTCYCANTCGSVLWQSPVMHALYVHGMGLAVGALHSVELHTTRSRSAASPLCRTHARLALAGVLSLSLSKTRLEGSTANFCKHAATCAQLPHRTEVHCIHATRTNPLCTCDSVAFKCTTVPTKGRQRTPSDTSSHPDGRSSAALRTPYASERLSTAENPCSTSAPMPPCSFCNATQPTSVLHAYSCAHAPLSPPIRKAPSHHFCALHIHQQPERRPAHGARAAGARRLRARLGGAARAREVHEPTVQEAAHGRCSAAAHARD